MRQQLNLEKMELITNQETFKPDKKGWNTKRGPFFFLVV
jgi:hypothetical protein